MYHRSFSTPPLFIWQCNYFLELYDGNLPRRSVSFEEDRSKLKKKGKKAKNRERGKLIVKKKYELGDPLKRKIEEMRRLFPGSI